MKHEVNQAPISDDKTWKPDTILIVEDDEGLNHLIAKKLKREGFQTISVHNGEEVLSKACQDMNLFLLLDYLLPDMTANDILDKLADAERAIPFVVMTGHGDEHIAVELMKRGAIDYIVKDARFIDVLPQKINRACEHVAQQRRLIAAEEALRASEELHRTLLDISPDEVTVTDLDGRIQKISKRTLSLHGFESVKEVIGIDSLNLIAPEDHEKARLNLQRTLKQGLVRNIEYVLLRKDGSRFIGELSLSLLKDKDGNPAGFVCITRDITERKQADAVLEEERNLLRTLIDNLPDLIYAKDTESRYFISNLAHKRFLKASTPDEIIGKSVFDLYPQNLAEQYYSDDQQVIRTGQPIINREEQSLDEQGNSVWNLTTKVPLRDRDGEVMGLVGIARDITEQKKAEEQIQKDLEEKKLLLKEIHHRVKNNLQVISSLLGLQSRRLEDLQSITALQTSIKRIHSMALIHEKLYQSQDLASINFKEYIKSLSNDLIMTFSDENKNITINYEVEDIYFGIDTAIPAGLLLNELLTNSIKHAFPAGRKGTISISLSRLKDKSFQLEFKDDGIGFPENVDFDNVESLGLNIIKTLTKQIEGNISFQNKKSTLFKINFMGYEYGKTKYSHR